MATEYRISTKLDPAGVVTGRQKVSQELRGIQTEAATTGAAINTAFDASKFDKSIGALIAKMDTLDKSFGDAARSSAAIEASNRTLVTSLDRLTTSAGNAGKAASSAGKGSQEGARGAAALEAATRRVLQAVDQEAAEMARLNALLADASALQKAGVISAEQLARVQKLVADGTSKATVSIGQQRAGYTQLGAQVQDITSTLSLGINPLVVLAQQGGQTAAALSLALGTAGTAGKVATFIAGPWGSLILAGVTILGQFGLKALNAGSALDEATAKLREDAQQSEISRKAKEAFTRTIEGQIVAQRELNKELDKGIKTQQQLDLEQINVQRKSLNDLIRSRDEIQRALTTARARADGPGISGGGTSNAGQQAQASADRIRVLQEKFDLLNKAINDAQRGLREAELPVLERQVEAGMDASAKATDRYATALGRLRQERARGAITQSEFTARLAAEKKALKDAQDAAAASKRESTAGPTTNFISPVSGGRISSGFGPRAAPTAGASTFHKGIDIAAPIGTPVKAAANGVVIYAGKLAGLGNAIIVDHGGGTITEYGHLSSVLTQKGSRVGQGEQIGAVGNTGISTGPHLDYRVKVGGRYVDPRKGAFRTDDTATDVRAATAAEAAARKAETARQAAERKAEQERDFVSGVEDQAATRGLGSKANTVQGQIAKALADFKRRFDREANTGEKTRITDALTQADARETAARFDEAYVQPLKRLQALQGKTGTDRAVLNAQLEESARLGRELTPVEAAMIDTSIRQNDALGRQASILESIKQPQQDYADQIKALNALLAQGLITQTQYNARVSDLGSAARSSLSGLEGIDPGTKKSYADVAAGSQEDDRYAQEIATFESNKEQLLALGINYDALIEAAHRRHVENMNNIDRVRGQVAITAASSTSESLVAIAAAGVGQQSAIYKGLFAVSKAFAIADSVMQIQAAIAKALNAPFPQNLVQVGIVAAQAASIVSNIQAVSLALADGGPVRRPGGQGLMRGPGGPRGDKIPVDGSDGEFMVNAAAVQRGGNLALLEAINSGSVTAGTRRASNDNAGRMAVAAFAGGGDTYSVSIGDVIVQGGGSGDDVATGREVRAQLTKIVREEITNAKRAGGALTKTRSSVMSG